VAGLSSGQQFFFPFFGTSPSRDFMDKQLFFDADTILRSCSDRASLPHHAYVSFCPPCLAMSLVLGLFQRMGLSLFVSILIWTPLPGWDSGVFPAPGVRMEIGASRMVILSCGHLLTFPRASVVVLPPVSCPHLIRFPRLVLPRFDWQWSKTSVSSRSRHSIL